MNFSPRITIVIFLTLFTAFQLNSQTDICFNPVTTYPAIQYPGAIVCADFNNDGIKDVAYKNFNAPSTQAVSMRMGSGSGTFGAITTFSVPDIVQAMLAADINNDGNQDLITQSLPSPSLTVIRSYLGSGSGSFSLSASVTASSQVSDMLIEDYDNDGIKDLVIAGNDYIRTYIGSGSGSFTAGPQFSSTMPAKLVSNDFDGDGKTDIAVASGMLTSIGIYLNNGAGNFSYFADYHVGFGSHLITLGDFNGDLTTDIAVASTGIQPYITVSTLPGLSGGGFGAASTFTLSDSPSALKSADINHDGRSDLIFASENIANISVFLGSSNGIIQTVRSYSVGYGARSLVVEDINADTWADIITPNFSVNTLGVILNKILPTVAISNSSPNLCLLNPVTLTATGTAATYTWTGGATNGVAFSPSVSTTYTVTGSSPNGCIITASTDVNVSNCSFLNACLISAGSSSSSLPASITSADFNSDGKADIAFVRAINTASIAIQNGNGTGGFGVVSYITTPHQNLELISKDFTNDGKSDLAVLANNSSVVSILPGNGFGGFGAAMSYTIGAGNNASFAAGDFNNDGKQDLGVSNAANSITFLSGNGSGSFSSVSTITVGTTPKSIVFADVNNDGNLDVYCGNNGSANVSILIGNGMGNFTALSPVAISGGVSSIRCKSADFNNDSNTDLVVLSEYDVQIFMGNGNGTFNSPVITPLSIWLPYDDLICRDMNLDGKTDLALSDDTHIKLMMGTGLGSFGSVSTYTFGTTTTSTYLTEADFNNDSRMDIAVARTSANVVSTFLNMLTPTVSISGNTNVCMGSSASLTASGASTYSWTGGITNGVAFTPTLSGVYSVTATAANGCVNYASQNVTVNPVPTVSINMHNPVISPGQTTILEASGSSTYTWNTGATTSTIVVAPQTSTIYTVVASTGSLCPGGVNSATVTQAVSAFSGFGAGQINYQWARHIPNSSGQSFNTIKTALDNNGNFILSSQYQGNIDLDPSAAVVNLNGSNARFIAKYDNNGALLWYGEFVSATSLVINEIRTDMAGNVYMSGNFQGTMDFDPSSSVFNLTSSGSTNIFILKLNAAGNLLWVKNISAMDCTSMDLDPAGNVYCVGNFSGTVDFDPSPAIYNVTGGAADIFTLKLSSTGNFVWAKGFGGSGIDTGLRVRLDTYGNLFVQGSFYQTADMDPSPAVNNIYTSGVYDRFLAKYNNTGDYLWAKVGYMGTLEIDNLNNLYFYGGMNNTGANTIIDMDYSIASSAYIYLTYGFYISKYDEYGNYVWAKAFNRRPNTTTGFSLISMQIDDNGELYLAGSMTDTQDLDPSSAVADLQSYGTDVFIGKYDNQCDYLFATHIGNTNGIGISSMHIDAAKNIRTCGTFGFVADFDPSPALANISTSNVYNLYMAKYGSCNSSLNIAVSSATLCTGTSAYLTASGVNTYSWSTGATGASISVTPISSTTYSLDGTDAAGCSYNQTVAVTVNQTCQDVWPGDANSDGLVDNTDVLELGLHFTQTGPARASTSNNWQSYFSNNWTGTITNGKNVNHSDCNGDGTVDNNDTLAIFNNYGLNHAFKPTEPDVVNPQLSIVPDQGAVAKGTWGTSSVFLGDASAPVSNINGLAFTVTFDQNLIDASSFYIEYPTSFINAGNQNLHFKKSDFANGKLYTATTHTLISNVSGQGKVAVLHYKIKSSLASDQILNIGITQAKQSDADGQLTTLTAGTATIAAIGASVGMEELLEGNAVALYPNPASTSAIIQSNTPLQKVEILSFTGQVVYSELASGNQHQIHLSPLANGVYTVTIYDAGRKIARKKLVVQH